MKYFLLLILSFSFAAHANDFTSTKTSIIGEQEPRVRVSFKVLSHEIIKVRNTEGEIVSKKILKETKIRNLKTVTTKKNHFYIDGFHVETIPLAFNKKTKKLALKINVYSSKNSFEEFLTSLLLKGEVSDGRNGIFDLNGLSHSKVKDKMGNLKADILVGKINLINDKIVYIKNDFKIML